MKEPCPRPGCEGKVHDEDGCPLCDCSESHDHDLRYTSAEIDAMRPLEHTWVIENIDGGPMGDDDVFRCSVCGCCGGPTERHKLQRNEDGTKEFILVDVKPHPFLPGPALDLSEDCRVTTQQVRAYILGYARSMWLRALRDKDDVRRKIFGLVDTALRRRTDVKNLVGVFNAVEHASVEFTKPGEMPDVEKFEQVLRDAGLT